MPWWYRHKTSMRFAKSGEIIPATGRMEAVVTLLLKVCGVDRIDITFDNGSLTFDN